MLNNTFYTRPHPDVELGYKRSILEYALTFPTDGVNEDTGLIMVITPFSDSPNSVYQAEKLRPHLADKYNCIVAGVNHFGIDRKPQSVIFDEQFLATIDQVYGVPYTDFFDEQGVRPDSLQILAAHLKAKGIKISEARPTIKTGFHVKGEYESFGFLPALDYLTVLGDIMKTHTINKKKIIAFGSSYGGYIALLLGKFAPHTFSTIIDNSGFSRVNLQMICTKDYKTGDMIYRDGDVTISGLSDEPWTLSNERSPYYFSDSCRSIRSLLEENHRTPSETAYYIFHSEQDKICSVSEKEEAVNLLKKYNPVYFQKVTENDLDGSVFKTTKHGMDASLRGLFGRVYDLDNQKLFKDNAVTDFELGYAYDFDCGKKNYRISYSDNFQVKVDILDR